MKTVGVLSIKDKALDFKLFKRANMPLYSFVMCHVNLRDCKFLLLIILTLNYRVFMKGHIFQVESMTY